jgi:phenylalanyl-tRNA synthetase beta chain
MKILPSWIRDFVEVRDDDHSLAEALTLAGVSIESFYGEGADLAYEAEITTNRVDAMNHYGIAREVSAIYDVDLKPLAPKLPSAKAKSKFAIEIEDPQGCARYTARIVRNVKIAPSPAKIARRLELIDQRPISNVADATNYTLNEMGQPTHAFDLDKLEGGKIIVRRARVGESLKTLDGVIRQLDPEDVVIADAVKPVALAGVMGGFDSMIIENTKNVLIESAWFDPAAIRRTSKRLGMHTDASHRFERGADWGITPTACDRVAELILASAGGELEEQIDAVGRKVERPTLQLRASEVHRILGVGDKGVDIPEAEIARIMRRLGFGVTPGRSSQGTTAVSGPAATTGTGGTHAAIAESVASFSIQVPTWRLDVDREIDLIEEIARIYGYNKFPNTLPEFAGSVVELPDARKNARLRTRLLAIGYTESISSTFIPQEEAKVFGGGTPVHLANPLSDEAAYMRTSLVPGMLAQVGYNLNRGTTDVKLFEAGDIFEMTGDKVDERHRVTFIATGNQASANVHRRAREFSFYDLKGDVEALLAEFDHGTLYYDTHVPEYYHPGRSCRVVMDGATVARFGQLHPDVLADHKIKQPVYVAELLLERLHSHELRDPQYTPIPRFPAVGRDFSFVFDNNIAWERICSVVEALGIPELRSFVPVEIFRGGSVPEGKYSILVRATFQAGDRTLRDDEVALWSQQIMKAIEAIGGALRG